MIFTFRRLSTWPGTKTPSAARKRSQLSAKYSQTLDLLGSELTFLKARNVVVEADCDESMIRQDGQLRANAKLNGPGIGNAPCLSKLLRSDSRMIHRRKPNNANPDRRATRTGCRLAALGRAAIQHYENAVQKP